jgi:hypothetical protein
MVTAESLRRAGRTEKGNHGVYDTCQRLGCERADLGMHEIDVGREEFARPRIAGEAQRAGREGCCVKNQGVGVALRLARDLTEHAVTTTRLRQDDGGAQFRLRKVRERESNEYYRTSCRCAHASSSSGRFQSSASDASLSNSGSRTRAAGRSSRIVTSARRAASGRTGSNSCTLPCSSMTASTVRITVYLPQDVSLKYTPGPAT